MGEFFVAFFKEAKDQPLATTIVIVGLLVFIWWFLVERPKTRKAKEEANDQRHKDSLMIAEHMAASNEVVKHSTAAIEHSSKVIEYVSKSQELLQAQVGDLKGVIVSHDERAQEIKNEMSSVLTAVQMCTKR